MEFEKRFCAFIDILGFKEKTKNFEDAVYVTNEYAPEHLVIMTKDDEST